MVVSMNCSEGGPLRIYPCTSEVQSVTQGTQERFAKNWVARSDLPIFFCSGVISGTHVFSTPMRSLEHDAEATF